MAASENFAAVFERLKAILQAYEPNLRVEVDEPGRYSLLGPYMPKYQKDLWFGQVKVGKNYVSYHLMVVYMAPELLNGLSDNLRKRMQGKSCFNFTHVDESLLAELGELTRRSVEKVRSSGFLG